MDKWAVTTTQMYLKQNLKTDPKKQTQELRRSTGFMAHPVFNSHHSETQMLRCVRAAFLECTWNVCMGFMVGWVGSLEKAHMHTPSTPTVPTNHHTLHLYCFF